MKDSLVLQVPNLAMMPSLTRLELSYNQIKSLSPLSACSALNLQELYVSNNKISGLEVNDWQGCNRVFVFIRNAEAKHINQKPS